MEFLETSLNDFDILGVTETHIDNQINDSDITLDSFPNIIHRKDRSNHLDLDPGSREGRLKRENIGG
jgi:hypothetical protein